MKRYFLLDQGDFFVNFMDAAEEELSSPLTNLSFGRIQHWLNTSIQITEHQGEEGIVMAATSTKNSDFSQEQQQPRQLSPNELRCTFARETLMVHLDRLHGSSGVIARNEPITPKRSAYGGIPEDGPTGLDVFMMDFTTIPFPVSLVLSPKAVEKYQFLFRLLFYTKQVERRLVGVWMDHQAMKELPSLQLPSLRRSLLLRQRMLHCVHNLIYYMMFEVIEPNWLEMEAGIASPAAQKGQTVDDILAVHNQFLERTVEACLLTNSDLVCALTRLLRTCLLFSNQMELFMKRIKIHDDRQQVATEKQKLIQRSLNDRVGGSRPLDRKALRGSMRRDRLARQERIQEQTRRVEREVAQPSYTTMVARYDDIFSKELVDFLHLVSQSNESSHSQRVNLCIRLDYNGFLS
jgi:gamma-tubulin complex component 2